MYQRFAALLIVITGVAGCQTATPGPQQTAVFQGDLSHLKSERDAGRISYTEWAERTGATARANVTLTPDQEAAMAYRFQLAQQVDAGKLTPRQFEGESSHTLQQLKSARQGA